MKLFTIDAYQALRVGRTQSYDDYRSLAKSRRAIAMSEEDFMKAMEGEDEDEDENEEPDEDEDENKVDSNDDDEETEKSVVSVDELLKSIQDYETAEAGLTANPASREAVLAEKFRAGTLTKSEQEELGQLWAPGRASAAGGDGLRKSLTERLVDADPDSAALIDASDILKSFVNQVENAIRDTGTAIERDSLINRNLLKAQGALIKSVAGVIADQQRLIKSQQVVMDEMGRRLGVLERQPVVRKSMGVDPRDIRPRPGQPGSAGGQLLKSQVQQGLRALTVKAAEAGDDVALDRLAHASARFESDGHIAPNIAQAIRAELGLAG